MSGNPDLNKFDLFYPLLTLYNDSYICPLYLTLIGQVPASRGVWIELNRLKGQGEENNPGSDRTNLIRKTQARLTL